MRVEAYIGYIKFQLKENAMTTATMSHSQAAFVNTAPRNVAKRQPALSLAEMFSVVQNALTMARSIPQTGRVSAKQVEKMRAMAAAL
ncbi:MAG: hypothetical protein ABWY05_08850 [Noviherbaspirillum sp.]